MPESGIIIVIGFPTKTQSLEPSVHIFKKIKKERELRLPEFFFRQPELLLLFFFCWSESWLKILTNFQVSRNFRWAIFRCPYFVRKLIFDQPLQGSNHFFSGQNFTFFHLWTLSHIYKKNDSTPKGAKWLSGEAL